MIWFFSSTDDYSCTALDFSGWQKIGGVSHWFFDLKIALIFLLLSAASLAAYRPKVAQ
jgi:hypothetical protein